MRNALFTAERRGRLSPENARHRLDGLGRLPIRTDVDPDLDVAMDPAGNHGISFYDALCLELARRPGAEPVTLDRSLAQAEGVSTGLL